MSDEKDLEKNKVDGKKNSNDFTPPPTVLSNDNLDINSNVGSFAQYNDSEDIEEKEQTPHNATKVVKKDHTLPIADERVDFEKFSKKKRTAKNTKFTVKVDNWLENGKTLMIIWGIIIFVIVMLFSVQLPMMLESKHIVDHATGGADKLSWVSKTASAGWVTGIISLCTPALPFLFLVASWVVGINGTMKSRNFHTFLWVLLAIGVLLMISTIICDSLVIANHNAWKAT